MTESDTSTGTKSTRIRRFSPFSHENQSCGFSEELYTIRKLVAQCETEIQSSRAQRLPGNVAFLADGRVLCRERSSGDSRYPYGHDGLNFWVTASGHMHGNRELFFLFLPSQEGQEPPITFFAGYRPTGVNEFVSHGLLPIPYLADGESRITDRYTIIGHDATYFVAETHEMLSAVRVFLDQSRPELPQINFSVYIQNLVEQPLEMYTSAYMNPFCRHRFVEVNEDRWFKKIFVERHSDQSGFGSQDVLASGTVLPPFVIRTDENADRSQSISNYALVKRTVCLRNSKTGEALPRSIDQSGKGKHGSHFNETSTKIVAQASTSRLGYVGSLRRSLSSARFLKTGKLEQETLLTVFNENAIIADLLQFNLPVQSNLRADYVFSIPENRDVLDLELIRPIDPADTDTALERERHRVRGAGDLSMSVRGGSRTELDFDAFNSFLPFLKQQVAVCTRMRGYMTPSANSLIGFRDIFQAIDGHLFDRPSEARVKILESLSYVLQDGRCPRQYSLPVNGTPGQADLREFVDQGVWAISTLYNYLAVTGDMSLLDESVGYHQVATHDKNAIYPAGNRDSVLEHLLRVTSYLDRQRDPETGLVLALYGDWNDALDGLGIPTTSQTRFGTGVSVMTSLQLYLNCAEMIEILTRHSPNRVEEHVDRFRRLREQLRSGLLKYAVVRRDDERRIVHGWGDQRQYFVGSFSDCDNRARDGLTSNAFWVLSNMLDEDTSLKEDLLKAFERLDSPYGLKTFEPGFRRDATGVGRIAQLPLGAAENGAVYVHATTFAIAALFHIGEPEKGWEQIAKILPFASHHDNSSHSPFVMPNSYVHNPQFNLTGQSMNDWQTGCSNVLLKLLIRYVFGFQPTLNYLCIAPAGWMPCDEYDFTGVAHNRRVRLVLARGRVTRREFKLNGEAVDTTFFNEKTRVTAAMIPYESLKTNQINEINIIEPDMASNSTC